MSTQRPDSPPSHFPWTWEWHTALDSTNRLAMERVQATWACGQSAHSLIIAARRQSAGRGQHGRTWESPAGGLYMSMAIESVAVEHRARLALVAGAAVANVLAAEGLEPRIRWPNDILLKGKKVAGILCEALAQGEKWCAIIGIGVNVNTATRDLPAALRAAATSLVEQDGKTRSVEALGTVIATSVGAQLALTRNHGLGAIVARVRELDALIGTHVRLLHQGSIVQGTGAGIANDGSLLLQTAGGMQAFSDGSISAAMV